MKNQPNRFQKATILLVDDDLALRKVLVDVLRGEGYQVIVAADGKSALSLARKHDGPIDLLVTDVMMPKLDGFDLQERILQERQDLRILVMSGALDEEIKGEDFALLRKPFGPEDLVERVKQILAAPASRGAF